MKSKAEDLLFCDQQINERTRSGITVDEWCKKNGFSRHKYYYWNHHISQKQKPDKEVIFAGVTSILSSADNNEDFGKKELLQYSCRVAFLQVRYVLHLTQSIKKLKTHLKDWALNAEG